MDSDEDLPGLQGSESDADDYSDNDRRKKSRKKEWNSDEAPDLCSTDEESFDEDDESSFRGGDVSNTGIRTGDMKKAAETWTTQFTKKSKTKDLDEYMDVLKKKVFGPIIFGQDEQLQEPWLDAMSKFGLTQNLKEVPERLKNEETVSRVVDMVAKQFKALSVNQLEMVLNFANRIYNKKSGEINILVGNRLQIDCLWQLKNKVDSELDGDESWQLKLGDRKKEKIVLIILISTLHYTHFILLFFHYKINSAREFLQGAKSDQAKAGVQRLKLSGNELYKRQNYNEAVHDYSKALEMAPYNHLLYSNRATCYFLMNRKDAARADAFRTYVIEPTWHKGYTRWAECLNQLGEEASSIWVIKEGRKLTTELYNEQDNKTRLKEMEEEYTDKAKARKAAKESKKVEKTSRREDITLHYVDKAPSSKSKKKSKKDKTFGADIDSEAPSLVSLSDEDHDASDEGGSDSDSDDTDYEDPKLDPNRKRVSSHAAAAATASNKKKEAQSKRAAQPEPSQPAERMQNPESRNRHRGHDFTSSSTPPPPHEKTEYERNEELRTQFKQLLAAGSRGLLKEVSREAVTSYEKALEFLKNHDKKILYYEEIDEVMLKYCMGLAHIDSGVEKNLHNAIGAFKEIGELEGKNYVFAFLGLGKAYMKLNHYHEAIPWVERGLDCVKNGVKITGRRSPWPGLSDELIEETDEAKLTELLTKMMSDCRNPPQPEGRCGLEECKSVKREIYYSDVPFSGFITLTCDERCNFDFHRNCYIKYKAERNIKSNKDILGGECPTPDCVGVVVEIMTTDHTTKQSKIEYQKPDAPEESKESRKKLKTKTQRAQPSAENLKKRLERKEEKKRERMEAKQIPEEEGGGATAEVVEEKEVFIPDEDEMIQLKSKDDDDDALIKVTKKQKHKNKPKENKEPKEKKVQIPIVFTDQSSRPLQSEKNLPRFLNQDSPSDQTSPIPPMFSPSTGVHGGRPSFDTSTPPPAQPTLDASSNSASQDSTLSGDSIYNSFGASDSTTTASAHAQAMINSETSGQQNSGESILVWCQALVESRGPMLVADMDPHLSQLSGDFQTVLADFGLSEIISNDAKKRCLILKDENFKDYVYYTPEQSDYARKLYLDSKNLEAERMAVAKSLREVTGASGNTDTIVFTKEPSLSPREPEEKLTLSSVSSILTKPKPEPSVQTEVRTTKPELSIRDEPTVENDVRKDVDELKDKMTQCCSLLDSAATHEPVVPTTTGNFENIAAEDHVILNANPVTEKCNDIIVIAKAPIEKNSADPKPPKEANGDSNLKSKVEDVTAKIDSIQGSISDGAAERLAKLELKALKALVTIAPSVITVGNLHFGGSPEQMTITQSGVSIVLYKEKLFRPRLGNPTTHLTKAWPVRLKIDMKFIKRVIGQWKEEPFKLFFAITSAGGKSINDAMGLLKFSEDMNRPQFNPDSYDNRIKWISVTFSEPSDLNGFEVIFKYASSSLGYNGEDVGPSLLKHLSTFEANALYSQLCSTIKETEKSLYFPGVYSTEEKRVSSKEVGTSLGMMDIEKLEGYQKLVKDMELKEKNYELEISRMKDEVKKKDTEKKRVDKELADVSSKAALKSSEVVDLHQKKSEMEKKLQNKISEKEKELTNFRGKNKELEQSVTSGQKKMDDMTSYQKTAMKEFQAMVKKWLLFAVQDYTDYETFVEKQLGEIGLGESQARVKLRGLLKEANDKKRELNKSLSLVDVAMKDGRPLSEELKRLIDMPRVTLDYGPILNVVVDHQVANARNNNNNNKEDKGSSKPGVNTASSLSAMGREIAKSQPPSRPASMESIANPNQGLLPGSYPDLAAHPPPYVSMAPHPPPSVSNAPHPPPSVSLAPNGVSSVMMHTGAPLRLNAPIPPAVIHGTGYGPFGQPIIMAKPAILMARPMTPTMAPPVRGPSVVVPRPIAPPGVSSGPIKTGTPPPAAVPAAPKSGVNKLIEDVQALHPEVEADYIKYIVTEFRKENGGKLSGIKMSELTQIISTRLVKKLSQFTKPQPATRYVPPSNLDDKTKFSGNASGDDCSICFEEMTSANIFHLPECHHPFHKRCIKKWLGNKSTCPLCQKHTKLEEDFPALN